MSDDIKDQNKSSISCIEVLMNTFESHLMSIGPENTKQKRAFDGFVKAYEGFGKKLERLKKAFKL